MHTHTHLKVELFERELTEKATGVLYELVQVSQQARWPLVRKSSVSTSWLVRALAENERMVRQTLSTSVHMCIVVCVQTKYTVMCIWWICVAVGHVQITVYPEILAGIKFGNYLSKNGMIKFWLFTLR